MCSDGQHDVIMRTVRSIDPFSIHSNKAEDMFGCSDTTCLITPWRFLTAPIAINSASVGGNKFSVAASTLASVRSHVSPLNSNRSSLSDQNLSHSLYQKG